MNPSALLECLHLEALGVRVSLWDSLCYFWWLPPPRQLGAVKIVERRLVIVSGSNRGDCEGFLTFPRRRAKRYSSKLLVAYVILILCWLCGTLLRVWRVKLIST